MNRDPSFVCHVSATVLAADGAAVINAHVYAGWPTGRCASFLNAASRDRAMRGGHRIVDPPRDCSCGQHSSVPLRATIRFQTSLIAVAA
jgi:hypothetical protein